MKWIREKNTQVVYSMLSGHNFYRIVNRTEHILSLSNYESLDKAEYYAKIIYSGTDEMPGSTIDWYSQVVFNRVDMAIFEWPIDLIGYEENGEYFGALVYQKDRKRDYRPIKDLLYQSNMSTVLDWRNQDIMILCNNLVKAIDALHKKGYLLVDFNMNQILYDEITKEVYLLYSPLCCKEGKRVKDLNELRKKVSPEFAPPFLYDTDTILEWLTWWFDYYQLTGILFRLMIGRLPYEGIELVGYGTPFNTEFELSGESYKHYFEQYQKCHRFIFDANNSSNRLSSMAGDNLPKERWVTMPQELREIFQRVLSEEMAMDPVSISLMLTFMEDVRRILNKLLQGTITEEEPL